MAKREKKRGNMGGEEGGLPMTPMIDVVFQLLIFFLVTIRPEDVVAHLDVFRPQPDPNARPEEKVEDLLTVAIFRDGYTLNGRLVSAETLESTLIKLAGYSTTQTVLIKCAPDSPHEKLIKLLDICAKAKLTNLSVFSL